MNHYTNVKSAVINNAVIKSSASSVNPSHTLCDEHYTTMDLDRQDQMSEGADNIISRMDKLRAFARKQQTKRVTSQRQQTSFCF